MIHLNITKPLHTADGTIDLVVNKEIENGDFLTLFGKSGSGKTTLLRIIAGLETPKSGSIIVDGVVWFDSEKRSMQRIWKQREKQIEKVLDNTINMYGSIRGIAGNAIGNIKALELGYSGENLENGDNK
jgi:ABC-type sulfate/molybdate transport systems ATPase subunit